VWQGRLIKCVAREVDKSVWQGRLIKCVAREVNKVYVKGG